MHMLSKVLKVLANYSSHGREPGIKLHNEIQTLSTRVLKLLHNIIWLRDRLAPNRI